MDRDRDRDQNQTQNHQSILYSILGQFVKQNPSLLLIYIVYLVVICLQDIVMPHLSGKAVNAIQNRQSLLRPFVYIVITVLTIQVLSTVTDWHDTLLFPNMQSFLRIKLLDNVFEKYRQDYSDLLVATMLAKLMKLPYTLFNLLDHYRYYIIPQIVVYTVAIIYLMRHDVRLGLALLLVVIIIIVSLARAPKLCEIHSQAAENASNNLSEETDDVLNNLMTVYSHDQEDFEKRRLETIHKDYVSKFRKTTQCTFTIKALLFPLVVVFMSYFMYRCYVLVRLKKIDSGKFVSLFLMTFYITNSMWRLIGQVREIVPRWGRVKENITVFGNVQQHVSPAGTNVSLPLSAPSSRSGLYLDDVWFKYAANADWVLKGVTLHIRPNERVAFVGRIGTGKTTLIKLIMGYKHPQKGEIFIDGTPYSAFEIAKLRRMIGYVHQYPTLFNRSIYDNIVYGVQGASKQDIKNLMSEYGIQDIFANLPDGLDSNVGRKGSNLSGGQRQMVWLLRVMLMNPKILILDEPTASVDDQTRTLIFKMLDVVMQNRTVIIVTHDAKLMKQIDRIIEIKDGSISNDSSREENIPRISASSSFMSRPDLGVHIHSVSPSSKTSSMPSIL